jgi:genome maintenance exonuclease 1
LRKIFEHDFFPKFNLERVVIDGKRHYATPTGEKYPSVTTVLDQKTDKTKLLEWRARVGEAEANKISTQAANRGTSIHTICEHYLMNETNYPSGTMPANIDTFKKLRPLIDKHIDKVYALEYYMFSHELQAAGATDCIAEFDGVSTIVDFKTARKPKKEEWIQNYFLQATAYAIMAEELLYEWQFKVPQIAILIAVDHEEPQLFVKPTYLYVDEVRELFA